MHELVNSAQKMIDVMKNMVYCRIIGTVNVPGTEGSRNKLFRTQLFSY